MKNGVFLKDIHRPYPVLVYYSGVRELEALRVTPESFDIRRTALYFEVGERLKHSAKTPPLKMPLNKPFMNLLKEQIEATAPGAKVFPFSDRTAYNIMRRAGFHYPHLLRLTRITDLFQQHFTIAQVKSWTGLSLRALNFYVGTVDIEHMGDKLR
jgi:integrase